MKAERPPNGTPMYAERELNLIRRFLVACSISAENGLKGAKMLACGNEDMPMHANSIEHWRKMLAAAKWFDSLATRAQRHLITMSDEDIQRFLASWEDEKQTSFQAVVSLQCVLGTVASLTDETHGNFLRSGLPVSSLRVLLKQLEVACVSARLQWVSLTELPKRRKVRKSMKRKRERSNSRRK